MAFIFQSRKSSKTKWVQGPPVNDWAQLHKFLGPSTPNSKAPTRKTDSWPPMIPAMQQVINSSSPAPAPDRINNQEVPVMDAMEAAMRYGGFYMCIIKKHT